MKLAQEFEAYLAASRIKDVSPYKQPKFYVSDMGKCLRTRFLKRKGIEANYPDYVYWTFEMGNMIHDKVYEALRARSVLIDTEQYVGNDHFVGRFDGIAKDDGVPKLFDVKSAGKYAMIKAVQGADNVENIMQVLTYVHFYLKDHPDFSREATLLYINKEPGDQMPKIGHDGDYTLDGEMERTIIKEMDTLTTYWLENKIPPCTCPGWMKNYNSFLPLCTGEESRIEKLLLHLLEGKKVVSTKTQLFLVTGEEREVIS